MNGMISLLSIFYKKIFIEKKIFILFRPLLLPLRVLTKITPRDKRVWVFGSSGGSSFTGNPKYLFLFLSEKRIQNIKPIWLTRCKKIAKELKDSGFEAYHCFSPKGIYYSLRSSVQLFDNCSNDLGYWFVGGGLKVNLWHGLPLKKIFHDDLHDMGGKKSILTKLILRLFRPWKYEKWNYTITTSTIFQEKFASGFKMPKQNILLTGYPRNDVFYLDFQGSHLGSSLTTTRKILSEKRNGRIIFAYLPTFRETGKNPLQYFDLNKMLNIVRKYNALLVIKLHPQTPTTDLMLDKDFMLLINGSIDIYPVIKHMDFLITDYSSVYLDFLLLDKPVVFYPFDLEEYLHFCRGFYFNYEEFAPGPIAKNFSELLKIVEKILSAPIDLYKEKRKELIEKVHFYRDGKSCERVVTTLLNILNTNPSVQTKTPFKTFA